uniref:Uncharacterized protein n=1 Tax=Haptolina brevifila TaxID=156173 RepID=A0A7S2IU30_9EUKA|mmetsp:Transcript_70724/g.140175  ORF Transcript_70724/g.140175 Transcript_70724/m.140175 type:complete len:275 (+) Transcript_70724:425-1249(+)
MSYERVNIERHIAEQRRRSPDSPVRSPIDPSKTLSEELVPNQALKALIKDFEPTMHNQIKGVALMRQDSHLRHLTEKADLEARLHALENRISDRRARAHRDLHPSPDQQGLASHHGESGEPTAEPIPSPHPNPHPTRSPIARRGRSWPVKEESDSAEAARITEPDMRMAIASVVQVVRSTPPQPTPAAEAASQSGSHQPAELEDKLRKAQGRIRELEERVRNLEQPMGARREWWELPWAGGCRPASGERMGDEHEGKEMHRLKLWPLCISRRKD